MDKRIKRWPGRLFYAVIAVVMTFGLLLAPATAPPVSAAEVNAEWDKADTPSTDDWTIAPGSVIGVFGSSIGGEVIMVVGSGYEDNDISNNRTPRMWTSEDSGMTWEDITDNVLQAEGIPAGDIIEFNYVVMPQLETDFVAVCAFQTGNKQIVLISDDRGETFAWTGPLRDDTAGTKVTEILSIALGGEDEDGKRTIIAGGFQYDPFATPSYKGLVYRYEVGGLTGGRWVDASNPDIYNGWDNRNDTAADITSWSVTTVAIRYDTVLAVSHTADEVYLQTGTWGDINTWNVKAGFPQAVMITDDSGWWSLVGGASTGLALPMDYDSRYASNRYAWVYVNRVSTREGIIYRVRNDEVVEVNQQIPGRPMLATFSYFGSITGGKAIAGSMGTGRVLLTAPPLVIPEITDCCEGVQVYRNDGIADMDICCQVWEEACKPPTGKMAALVAYIAADKAYCAVIGVVGTFGGPFLCEEGGLSFSKDDGDTWNQLGLVNTYVDYVSDVVKSAACNETWVVTVNAGTNTDCFCPNFNDNLAIIGNATCDSVWMKAEVLPFAREYNGAWIRVWSKEFTHDEELNSNQTPEMGLLRLAPEETEEALTVYLVDRGADTVYYDGNKGLGCWEQGSSTVDNITDLAVQDEATIYALDFNGDVAVSDDHGFSASWSSTMGSKVDHGHTIAVLGEGNVLVGGADGKVAYSDSDLDTFLDGEASFTELDDIGDGRVHVAFDSYFDSNSVVYAAVSAVDVNASYYETPVNDADNGIYRWVIDESTAFTDLGECTGTATPWAAQLGYDRCDEVDVGYYGIVLDRAEGNPETDATTGGVLYAAFYDADGNVTGVARCLNPAEEVACGEAMWDYLIQGVAANATFTLEPSSLKICGCLTPDTYSKLWAIDDNWYYGYWNTTSLQWEPAFATANATSSVGRLWTYEDCYAKAAPPLKSPATGAVVDADPCYCWNDAFTLKWDRQCDACSYNLQISLDEDFTEVITDWSGKYKDIAPYDCTEIDYEPTSGSKPSYVVENGALGTGSCGTTFYWRVRSADAETDEIIHSWWSEVRSFTVAIGPMAAVTLTNPGNGANGVAVSNIPFTWDAVADSTGYEFSLTNAATDDEVVSATSVSGVTYTYTDTLSYSTSYYWTVKAMKDTTVFGEATGTFTTGAEGVVPPAPTIASWLWVIIALGAVVWLVILVLIFRTRRV